MSLDNIEIVFALLTAIVATIVVAGMLFVIRERSRSRYDETRQRAELSEIRIELERGLRNLNERLTATQERWSDVNHLVLSAQKFQETHVPESPPHLSAFLRAAGVTLNNSKIDQKLVFVLTPFHPEFQDTYDTISKVAQHSGLKCRRGDEEFTRGDILSHILKQIVQARVIVANLEGRNPNVFYELGIAQAIDKPVILISKVLHDVPFDVKAHRLLLYSDEKELREKLQNELVKVFAERVPE